jgi:hypothetical protein
MVLIHVKKGTDATHEFLLEAKTGEPVDSVTNEAARMHNLRLRCGRLAVAMRQLAKYGPMKPEAQRGLSEEEVSGASDSKMAADADPTGIRVGAPPSPQAAQTLVATSQALEATVDHRLVAQRKSIDEAAVLEALQNCKGAVMIAYPMQLPPFDEVREILEDREELQGKAASKEVLEPAQAVLWFAGHQMLRDQPLSKYTGTNEKCKIIAKLARLGQGAPQREPTIDEESRRNLMALYHRKEQQRKALAEDSDDSYLSAEWANPNALRASVTGTAGISFRPF